MSPGVLAAQLANLVPVASEAAAIVTMTNAYGTFAADAVAGPSPITAAGVALGKAAMQGVLVGMSAPGAGAAVLAVAVQAFWVAVASGLGASFAGAIAIVPPPNAGLQALLLSTFASNTAARADLPTAALAVATAMYNQAIIGGTATIPVPVPTVFPIT